MTNSDTPTSPLDALSDAEYDARVGEAISVLMDSLDAAIDGGADELEKEVRYAAAPTALRNLLAQLIAEQCLEQPRPYKLVKELIRDLELEAVALAMLKELQAEGGEEA